MDIPSLIVIVVLVLFLLGMAKSRSPSSFRIPLPTLGFLNLVGPTAEPYLNEDREAVASLFATTQLSSGDTPRCDVLFVYADLEKDGRFKGGQELRSLIPESGAKVLILASDNPGEACAAAAKRPGPRGANLVLTLSRKGTRFATFMNGLFSQMKQGTSMPVAWVSLAPQIPGEEHVDCPETIFLAEAGQVVLR